MLEVELGGGANPVYHPNIDVYDDPLVDIVHDLREGIPLEDNSAELLFSQDFAEHLLFDDFIKLLSECKRVLVKGGKIEFIVPDVYRTLFAWSVWNEHTHHVVIGDDLVYRSNNWNSGDIQLRHKMWFTPRLMAYILNKEGWENIEIGDYIVNVDWWKEPKFKVVATK